MSQGEFLGWLRASFWLHGRSGINGWFYLGSSFRKTGLGVGWGHPLQHGRLGVVLLAAGRERFLSGERIEIFGGISKSEKLWQKSRLCWLAGAWGFD